MELSSHASVGERVLSARIQLALRQPFLATAMMRLPVLPAAAMSWCRTMCTDGFHIFFNPSWVETLTDAEIRGVLAHELLHVIFAHLERRGTRDMLIWNQACDYGINLLLLEQGMRLPQGGLICRDYAGMTSEAIYEALAAGETGGTNWRSVHQAPLSDEDCDGSIPSVGDDLLHPDDPRCAPLRIADAPDHEELEAIRTALRKDICIKLQGRSAAQFSVEVLAAADTRIDWRALLRQWLFDKVRTDWVSYPYAKKFLHRGLFLPSSGVQMPANVVFAVDTSGSIDEPELGAVFSEVRGFLETFPCGLTVIQADDEIRQVLELEDFGAIDFPEIVRAVGRGGTDFRPTFSWCERMRANSPSLLIYSTDGYGTFPLETPSFPVIWIVSAKGLAPERFPFGYVLRLTDRPDGSKRGTVKMLHRNCPFELAR
jgi:predicted metal-dependent peptidase